MRPATLKLPELKSELFYSECQFVCEQQNKKKLNAESCIVPLGAIVEFLLDCPTWSQKASLLKSQPSISSLYDRILTTWSEPARE